MNLRERLDKPDPASADRLTPTVIHRAPERRVPEWLRRSLEARERDGFVAVADISGGPAL